MWIDFHQKSSFENVMNVSDSFHCSGWCFSLCSHLMEVLCFFQLEKVNGKTARSKKRRDSVILTWRIRHKTKLEKSARTTISQGRDGYSLLIYTHIYNVNKKNL
jgi:hypothetical protein